MALIVKEFYNCCNAKIIAGFGGTHTQEYGDENDNLSVHDLRTLIRGVILNHGHNMLVAITNNKQVRANKALRLCGFEHSPWMQKLWHEETEMRLWYRRPTTDIEVLGRLPFFLK